MTIMVDELQRWPTRIRCFMPGSCHLLHAFAARIGLRRSWFQEHPLVPHYDLTVSKRAAAIEAGAVFVSAMEQARRRRRDR